MPEYTFQCKSCNFQFNEFWQVSQYDKKIKKLKCTSCGSKDVYRNYIEDNVYGGVREVKTVGQLAERNEKRLGKEQVQKIRESHKSSRNRADTEVKMPGGMRRISSASDFVDYGNREELKKQVMEKRKKQGG